MPVSLRKIDEKYFSGRSGPACFLFECWETKEFFSALSMISIDMAKMASGVCTHSSIEEVNHMRSFASGTSRLAIHGWSE